MARLIDADELAERVANLEAVALEQVSKYEPGEEHEEWKVWTAILNERTAFKFDLFDAPTVDPIKHGHWIEVQRIHEKDHTAICECSLCGDTVWVYDGQRAWNYCPRCGAKMDEVKVNNSKGLDFWMTKEQFSEIYEAEDDTDGE